MSDGRTPPRGGGRFFLHLIDAAKKKAASIKCHDVRFRFDSRIRFFSPIGPENFSNDSFHRCDAFCQKIVQIGAILAIFRPFAGKVTFAKTAVTAVTSMASIFSDFWRRATHRRQKSKKQMLQKIGRKIPPKNHQFSRYSCF